MIFAAATISTTVATTVAAEWAVAAFGLPMGGGGLGIGTIIVLGLVGYAFGIDPRILIGGAEILTGGGRRRAIRPIGDRHRQRGAHRRDGQHDRWHSWRDRRSLDRNFPGRAARPIPGRASYCFAMQPMAAAAAWRSRRWGRSTARRTSKSFSIPASSAKSKPNSTAVRACVQVHRGLYHRA